MEMPFEWLPILANHCGKRSVDFLCTPFDETWVAALDPYVPAFKIASYELSHLPLVRAVLERDKPAFISTGASALADVLRVVELAREVGNTQIVLLQCTAAYPTPTTDVNARAIVTLREASDCLVGLSDHSRDPVIAPVVAVALGAVVVEKHFTLSNRLPGPDQKFAIEPEELKGLVRAVRGAQAALGSGVKEVLAVESELHAFARRSVFSVRAIGAGEMFTEDNIRVLRNGSNAPGLAPEEYPRLLGMPGDAAELVHDVADPVCGARRVAREAPRVRRDADLDLQRRRCAGRASALRHRGRCRRDRDHGRAGAARPRLRQGDARSGDPPPARGATRPGAAESLGARAQRSIAQTFQGVWVRGSLYRSARQRRAGDRAGARARAIVNERNSERGEHGDDPGCEHQDARTPAF
jgi:N-acetylneuraminate synthase